MWMFSLTSFTFTGSIIRTENMGEKHVLQCICARKVENVKVNICSSCEVSFCPICASNNYVWVMKKYVALRIFWCCSRKCVDKIEWLFNDTQHTSHCCCDHLGWHMWVSVWDHPRRYINVSKLKLVSSRWSCSRRRRFWGSSVLKS